MKKHLLAVSHDAGGAEVLSSYLNHTACRYRTLRCVVEGPAKIIFMRKGLKNCIIGTREGRKLIFDKKIDMLISSTSRSSDLEKKFIKLAKKHSIKTAAMLEHWIYYKERFNYPAEDWKTNLPDEIWVLDKLANKIAEKDLGKNVNIKIKPNLFFKDLRLEYANTKSDKNGRFLNILFLNEPALGRGILKKKKIRNTEVKKVTRLIDFIKAMDNCKPIRFTIRQHPIESPLRYSEVLKDNLDSRDFTVNLTNPNSSSLIADIKNADVVMGMRSSALIIASFFKDTICCCNKPPLWFSAYNIKHVRPDLGGLKELLRERGR